MLLLSAPLLLEIWVVMILWLIIPKVKYHLTDYFPLPLTTCCVETSCLCLMMALQKGVGPLKPGKKCKRVTKVFEQPVSGQ